MPSTLYYTSTHVPSLHVPTLHVDLHVSVGRVLMGLGEVHIELEEYEEALPFLGNNYHNNDDNYDYYYNCEKTESNPH